MQGSGGNPPGSRGPHEAARAVSPVAVDVDPPVVDAEYDPAASRRPLGTTHPISVEKILAGSKKFNREKECIHQHGSALVTGEH